MWGAGVEFTLLLFTEVHSGHGWFKRSREGHLVGHRSIMLYIRGVDQFATVHIIQRGGLGKGGAKL
jgi:hypothetical protein